MSGAATAGSGRVRKNSVANTNVGGTGGVGNAAARPRANTIGHLDLASLGLMQNGATTRNRMDVVGMAASHRLSMSVLPAPGQLDASAGATNAFGTLPKLETNGINHDLDGGLRTAPPYVTNSGFDFDQLFPPGAGNTINPAQLHFAGSSVPISSQFPHFSQFDGVPDGISARDATW